MPFTELGQIICGEEAPSFLGLFDFSTAPPFLFYSYIPIIIAALLVAFYVVWNNKKLLQARLLLVLTLSFVLWVANILVQWVASYHTVLFFSWQLTAIFEVSIFLSIFYFAYVFFYKQDIPFIGKIVLGMLILGVIVVTPTAFNATSYDVYNCEGINGTLWQLLYALEPGAIAFMIILGISAYRKATDKHFKNQITVLTTGIALFLGIFFLSNFYGEITRVYEFNLWGPLGMLLFLVLLTYMIVQYHAFNVKLLATQALVWVIVFLIGARLFYSTVPEDFLLTAVTLIAFALSGIFLVRSVKREIEQREHIEILAVELEQTNERQEGLIHFIGHEVKGFLTKDAGAFASLSDGDFGALPEPLKPFVTRALIQSRDGVRSVTDILTAANQKKGTITYAKAPFDLKAVIAEVIEKEQPTAKEKNLTLSFSADDSGAPYTLSGDKEKIADNVFRNLIENAVNYTPAGTITASLKKENAPSAGLGTGKIVFTITDTGVGISDEDKKNLFTEGGHGKDSQKTNIHSTGYGLYIAKNIVEAHGGTITCTSDGPDKGSTFIVEFPAQSA